MLFFFDETFRKCRKEPQRPFGALCGIGIPEAGLAAVADEFFRLKRSVMGKEFAEGREVKGKELFKNWVFKLQTPFFAISQTHNAGLQLADIVTTVIGLRFEGSEDIQPFSENLKKAVPRFELEIGRPATGLKVLRDGHSPGKRKRNAPDGPRDPRSGQESPTPGAALPNHGPADPST